MTDITTIKHELSQMLSLKRFQHSIAVAYQAKILAEKHGADASKAYIAGLVHDACKEIPKNEQLKIINEFGIILTDVEKKEPNIWHGYAASGYIKEKWGIADEEICSAVKFHTCGKGGMSLLEKIIFIADLTSADRDYPDAPKIREISMYNLDEAIYNCYLYIIPFILNRRGFISQNTLDCYNSAVKEMLKS